MSDFVRFIGQAAEVIKASEPVRFAYDEDPWGAREILDKHIQAYNDAQNDNGEYRIPRNKLIEADPVALEEMDRRLKEIAGERGLDVMVETDFETNECVVRWWKR